MHVAAASPPDLAELHGHDLPIAPALDYPEITPARTVVEMTASLAAEFRLRGRDPMTVRELLAVCQVATRVAAYRGGERRHRRPTGPSRASSLAKRGVTPGTVLALYTDGARLRASSSESRSRVLAHAMQIEDRGTASDP